MSVDALGAAWTARVEAALERSLPAENETPTRLHAAMRHAVLGGGKRIRPRLVHASGHLLGADVDALDAAAVAIELIHAYSLVHDDLPAMDDDDLRRSRPTVHVAFDEATAILVGDALQALAFRVLATTPVPATVRIDLVATLAEAAGSRGMCGGQQLDMDATGQSLALNQLEQLHALKTGALIRASVRLGALIGGADAGLLTRLDGFAADLGLAFQIRDDILDVEADAAQLGKTAGKDAAQDKSTYPALVGLDGSKKLLVALAEKMKAALGPLDDRADALRAVAEFAVARVS